MVVLRKRILVSKGEELLLPDIRYFFYITNDWKTNACSIVLAANQRCNQENLIQQLKDGVKALHAPVNSLNANWAYMVMSSLAWSLKAWFALLMPVVGRWRDRHEKQREEILHMEFKNFLNSFIRIPCQILERGRRIIYRILSCPPEIDVFLRAVYAMVPLRL